MLELLVVALPRLLLAMLLIGGSVYVGTVRALDVYFDEDQDSIFIED